MDKTEVRRVYLKSVIHWIIKLFIITASMFTIIYMIGCVPIYRQIEAARYKHQLIRDRIFEKIDDQKVFTTVALKCDLWEYRVKATREITDQTILEKIAIEDDNWNVRFVAVKKITNQAILKKIAIYDNNWNVRFAAVERINDQNLLSKIAEEDSSELIRYQAKYKLSDPNWLHKIAVETENDYVAADAVSKIEDQNVLSKIAIEAKSPKAFWDAFDKITHINLIEKIVLKAENENIRSAALKKIYDQSLIAKIIMEDKSEYVQNRAFEKLTDQILLTKIALEGDADSIRRKAMRELSNQDLLSEVACKTDCSSIGELAINKLTKQELFEKVALDTKIAYLRYYAINKLYTQNLKDKIVLKIKNSILDRIEKLDINKSTSEFFHLLEFYNFDINVIGVEIVSKILDELHSKPIENITTQTLDNFSKIKKNCYDFSGEDMIIFWELSFLLTAKSQTETLEKKKPEGSYEVNNFEIQMNKMNDKKGQYLIYIIQGTKSGLNYTIRNKAWESIERILYTLDLVRLREIGECIKKNGYSKLTVKDRTIMVDIRYNFLQSLLQEASAHEINKELKKKAEKVLMLFV